MWPEGLIANEMSGVKESLIHNVIPLGSMDVDRDGCFHETNPFSCVRSFEVRMGR